MPKQKKEPGQLVERVVKFGTVHAAEGIAEVGETVQVTEEMAARLSHALATREEWEQLKRIESAHKELDKLKAGTPKATKAEPEPKAEAPKAETERPAEEGSLPPHLADLKKKHR